MSRWHLIYTKARQEDVAFNNLLNQGYECFLPFITREKISRGKKFLIKESMFPRYLFVCLRDDGYQNWSPIRSTKGVSHLVSFGGHLATLDDEIINNLKQNINKNLIVNAFSYNDGVEIVDGPFKGLKALFKVYNGEQRAILLIDFMAKHIHAKFDLRQFKKVA